MAGGWALYRDEGDLLGSLIVHFEVLLQHRSGRITALKELAVYRVHSSGILHLAQIDGTENNIGEIHVSFLQSIQQIAHGLPQLSSAIQFGASPRASINLIAAARALAFLRGRKYALATDVEYLAPEILRHRLVLTYESLAAGGTADAAVRLLLSKHPAPRLDLADHDAA